MRSVTAEKWFLLVASLIFYISWNVPCLLLILFTTLVDFSIARKISQTADPVRRKRWLVTSLVMSIGLLSFFKYANFFLENIGLLFRVLGADVDPIHLNVILPPAISFYTFASIAYVLDVYYQRIPVCKSARDYTLFITFFPKLLSGPIARVGDLLPQFQERVRTVAKDVEIGLGYCLLGAVKKMVIADHVGPHVDLIFAAPTQYDGLTLLMGLLGYTVQVYCDFSGYSDIAIGCARILGFRLPENFQMPYSARNITDLWRRWHMTLSGWFRDYLFLPLEMATRHNPRPTLRVSINMTVTMLLCGLWHGASWNFVIWGGLQGVALSIHKVWTTRKPTAALKQNRIYRPLSIVFSHVFTLSFFVLSMIFFRARYFSDAMIYGERLFTWASSGTRLNSPYIFGGVVALLLAHLLINKDRNLSVEMPEKPMGYRVLWYGGLLLLLVFLGTTGTAPFIYFQF